MLSVVLGGLLLIALQVYLSKRRNKWAGLILPGVSVGFSLLTLVGMLGTTTSISQSVYYTTYGRLVFTTETMGRSYGFWHGVLLLIMYNLPTIILLFIYGLVKGFDKIKQELRRMSIRDL